MKQIIVFGFPKSGTTVVRDMLGHAAMQSGLYASVRMSELTMLHPWNTPDGLFHLARLFKDLAPVLFLRVVRHPIDVVLSYLADRACYAGEIPDSPNYDPLSIEELCEGIMREWRSSREQQEEMMRFRLMFFTREASHRARREDGYGCGNARFATLRYADLAGSPGHSDGCRRRKVLSELANHLGLDVGDHLSTSVHWQEWLEANWQVQSLVSGRMRLRERGEPVPELDDDQTRYILRCCEPAILAQQLERG